MIAAFVNDAEEVWSGSNTIRIFIGSTKAEKKQSQPLNAWFVKEKSYSYFGVANTMCFESQATPSRELHNGNDPLSYPR